jgi:hypothetical protein
VFCRFFYPKSLPCYFVCRSNVGPSNFGIVVPLVWRRALAEVVSTELLHVYGREIRRNTPVAWLRGCVHTILTALECLAVLPIKRSIDLSDLAAIFRHPACSHRPQVMREFTTPPRRCALLCSALSPFSPVQCHSACHKILT